jgi:hypothetical protein
MRLLPKIEQTVFPRLRVRSPLSKSQAWIPPQTVFPRLRVRSPPERGTGMDPAAVGERLAPRLPLVSKSSWPGRVLDVANQGEEFVGPVTNALPTDEGTHPRLPDMGG